MSSPRANRRLRDISGLVISLLVVFVAAALGAFASANAGDFYQQLQRPAWAPPGWLFGPVWTALYIMMAIAAWLVWRRHGYRGAGGALNLFALQLLLNGLWTWLFFAWRLGGWALLEILVLDLILIMTLHAFWRVGPSLAALLLVPYLAWVLFASALNYAVWQLNPQLLS